MAHTNTELTVSLIHIPTWENDLEVYEITDPIPVGEWLEVRSSSIRYWSSGITPPRSTITSGGTAYMKVLSSVCSTITCPPS